VATKGQPLSAVSTSGLPCAGQQPASGATLARGECASACAARPAGAAGRAWTGNGPLRPMGGATGAVDNGAGADPPQPSARCADRRCASAALCWPVALQTSRQAAGKSQGADGSPGDTTPHGRQRAGRGRPRRPCVAMMARKTGSAWISRSRSAAQVDAAACASTSAYSFSSRPAARASPTASST
jgi:hypothetical protein